MISQPNTENKKAVIIFLSNLAFITISEVNSTLWYQAGRLQKVLIIL